MLVDINLIEKKKSPYKPVIFIGIFLLLVLLAVILLISYNHRLNLEEASLQQKVNYERQLRTVQNAKERNIEPGSIQKLSSAIEWGETYPVSTVALIKEITGKLPDRGYILTFSYSSNEIVSLTVQFDTAPEAAYYLKNLKESPFIKEVSLGSIVTEGVDEAGASLPRYLAQYNLIIDNDAIRNTDSAKEGVNDEQ
ncbi:PilN domain-containing protein [Falsibacillus pallidus]|uniref:Type IV pilus assembly protein PilN n=1 Tax=Falsibacillus pallidus TaxID=493781 RepID=A0A370GNX7_9BACI|nr:PilN domain-containing protein [Falsibacillus pallidus]RDI44154.1 type IV pilus assembly protein PilN [Falsibacillus pallidus]